MMTIMKKTATRQAGFTMISAIFILVVLASLGAFVVNISTTQQLSSAQDLQGAKAYQAARAGIEWGLYQVLDPKNTTAATKLPPDCPAASTTLTIQGFTVTVTCTRYPLAAAPNDYYKESGSVRSTRVYELKSTAKTSATLASPGYIERQLQATVSKCRASDGVLPDYGCP